MTHEEDSLVIERRFDAPRELVWRAWTDPEMMKQWWGPRGFTAPSVTLDLRVGGTSLMCMRSPDGQDFWSTGTYKELVEPELLVTTDSFADEKGNVVSADHYGMSSDFPLELEIRVKFEDEGGKTKMTLEHIGFPAGQDRNDARDGWDQSFDKLDETLKSVRKAA